MSSDANNEYFSDGLSEELLNLMTKFPDLKVAGRTSSFVFKGTNDDLRTIGQALNVRHLLEGSVRKQGNDVRITAQLVGMIVVKPPIVLRLHLKAEEDADYYDQYFDCDLEPVLTFDGLYYTS